MMKWREVLESPRLKDRVQACLGNPSCPGATGRQEQRPDDPGGQNQEELQRVLGSPVWWRVGLPAAGWSPPSPRRLTEPWPRTRVFSNPGSLVGRESWRWRMRCTREQWDERVKCAYQPCPTQRMGELLEINRENKCGKGNGWAKNMSQRLHSRFPSGPGGLSSTDSDTQDMRLLCTGFA